MKIYIKFFTIVFIKSLLYVVSIMFSLVFILNLLSELEFFKGVDVGFSYPILLSLLNSPAMIFEMLPFIYLITTQLFFIKLFNNNEIEIFKYSGLKNSKILIIFSVISIISGIIITMLFYNFSANLKNFYLEKKTQHTNDEKYLAVITKNGLWIKDEIDEKIYIINSSQIKNNLLINNFITEFDKDYRVIRNFSSEKINIQKKNWLLHNVKIYNKNNYEIKKILEIKTNFNYKRIQSLYSNLSSLNIMQLIELRKNYKKLNYSLTEVNLQLLKIISYPLFLLLVSFFSALIMFRIKRLHNTTFKISLGLFFSVIIYYINNFFLVMGSTERISLTFAILVPLIILTLTNSIMINKINEK
ncbi:LptF/LptG family permease [Candidatus Pelagibacter sp.]|nr:LptF/LptG family permease [Candidatus Pelagibacter sp.]